MSSSVLERSMDPGTGAEPRIPEQPGQGAGAGTPEGAVPRGYLRALTGLFVLWIVVVAVGIVMQSGPALSFG